MARILVLSPYEPPPDGIARHTSHLVNAWDAAGHNVLVISPGKERGLKRAEPIGLHSKVARTLGPFPRRRTWNDVVHFEPDVVVAQFAIAAVSVNLLTIRSLCRRFAQGQTPVVVTFHEPAREYNLLGFVSRQIYRSMARVTNVPVVFSLAGQQALVEDHLFEEVTLVPHGTTGVATVTDEDVRRVRDYYAIRKPLVLTLGFSSADKGADVLLDAVSTIAKDRDNDVQFLVAGAPRKRRGVFRLMGRRDVKWQQRLENQAKRIENVDVTFSGFVADRDVAALLFVADVVALPYRNITQSGIANLALSSRSVVVASDLQGLRSDLGDAAQYVEVGNSRILAEQISALLGVEGESTRQHLRQRSGERAAANTYAKVAEAILTAGLACKAAGDST